MTSTSKASAQQADNNHILLSITALREARYLHELMAAECFTGRGETVPACHHLKRLQQTTKSPHSLTPPDFTLLPE